MSCRVGELDAGFLGHIVAIRAVKGAGKCRVGEREAGVVVVVVAV